MESPSADTDGSVAVAAVAARWHSDLPPSDAWQCQALCLLSQSSVCFTVCACGPGIRPERCLTGPPRAAPLGGPWEVREYKSLWASCGAAGSLLPSLGTDGMTNDGWARSGLPLRCDRNDQSISLWNTNFSPTHFTWTWIVLKWQCMHKWHFFVFVSLALSADEV